MLNILGMLHIQLIIREQMELIVEANTYSYRCSCESSSLSWVFAIIVTKVEECRIVPHQRENKSKKKTAKDESEKRRGCVHMSARREKEWGDKETHENHPIPQPKQGRGLSNMPSCGSSASCILEYSPFLRSTISVEIPEVEKDHLQRLTFFLFLP